MEKKRVLIIDDEKDFTQMVKFALEEFGEYAVMAVNVAQEGLRAAKEYRPDVILLDVIMPDMEGPDVFDQLCMDQEVKDIPKVFYTATITAEEVLTNQGLIGGRRFLAKGGTVQELIECIETTLIHSRY